jgi:hypothetical protein
MKRILLVLFLSVVPLIVFSQKATIRITRSETSTDSEWKILDERFMPAVTGDLYPNTDTMVFSLEANKRYFFEISVFKVNPADTSLYTLSLNEEAIILIRSDIGSGDHFFPFFTGVKNDETAKITGGSDADISEFPWQIYLEADSYTCGGSIISNEWIITAAHCTKGDYNEPIAPSKMDVIVGANNPRSSLQGKKYFVSEVIAHELYDPETLNNDIALLKLKQPIDYVNAEPIKLISEKDVNEGATDPGVLSWVTGYGLTRVTPATYPTTLQKVQMPIVTNEQASTVWSFIPESDMMAGYRNVTKDACSGDSGGPLVVPVSGEYKLAGLVSWGSTKCNTYGAYTRLSLFESWITENTGIEITFKAPVPQGDSIICPGTASSEYNVSPVNGATGYEWLLTPVNAGSITGNNEKATVFWSAGFTGTASVSLQVSRNTDLSEVSRRTVNKAKQTRILSEPEDKVMCAEQPVTFKVDAEGYNLIYSWYKNEAAFKSGTTGEVTFSNALVDDSGNYFCEVEGSCGYAISGTSILTILAVTRINTITPDTEVSFGDDLTLAVISDGHNLTYQWYKDDLPIDNATLSSLILQNADAKDIGLYKVTVAGSCGTETSSKSYIYVKKEGSKEDFQIFVWPTVVNDEFTVALNNDRNYTVLLFNTTGKLLMKKDNCQYQTIIQTGELSAGVFILTVYNQDFRKSVKLIKK